MLQLIDKARKLFKIHHLSTDWKIVEKVEPDQLINSLSMICPFSVSEKQGLLEAKTLLERNVLINQIINFYIMGNNLNLQKQSQIEYKSELILDSQKNEVDIIDDVQIE